MVAEVKRDRRNRHDVLWFASHRAPGTVDHFSFLPPTCDCQCAVQLLPVIVSHTSAFTWLGENPNGTEDARRVGRDRDWKMGHEDDRCHDNAGVGPSPILDCMRATDSWLKKYAAFLKKQRRGDLARLGPYVDAKNVKAGGGIPVIPGLLSSVVERVTCKFVNTNGMTRSVVQTG